MIFRKKLFNSENKLRDKLRKCNNNVIFISEIIIIKR